MYKITRLGFLVDYRMVFSEQSMKLQQQKLWTFSRCFTIHNKSAFDLSFHFHSSFKAVKKAKLPSFLLRAAAPLKPPSSPPQSLQQTSADRSPSSCPSVKLNIIVRLEIDQLLSSLIWYLGDWLWCCFPIWKILMKPILRFNLQFHVKTHPVLPSAAKSGWREASIILSNSSSMVTTKVTIPSEVGISEVSPDPPPL